MFFLAAGSSKSKALVLKVVTAEDEDTLIELMSKSLKKIFDVDAAYLKFFTNSEMNDLEESTGMTFSAGETKHGSFANEKIQILFGDDSIKSVVISVFKNISPAVAHAVQQIAKFYWYVVPPN